MSVAGTPQLSTKGGGWPRGRLLVALVLAFLVGATTLAGPAGASVPVGTATITEPGSGRPLDGGGSATPYGVELPANAKCPADSAHHGFRIDTYLVPEGVSPTSVSFKTGVPGRWFGYIADGAYVGALDTAPVSAEIVGLPTAYTWSRLTPHDLFAHGAHTATWEGGIACADANGVVTNYWNSEVTFTASAADRGGFTWAVTSPATSPGGTGTAIRAVLGGGGLVLVAVAVVLERRRRRRRVVAGVATRSPRSTGPSRPTRSEPEVEHADA